MKTQPRILRRHNLLLLALLMALGTMMSAQLMAQDNALNFDQGPYVLVSNPNDFNVGASTDFTIEAVIRTTFNTPNQSRTIFSKMTNQASAGYQLWVWNGRLLFEWAFNGVAGQNITGGPVISDGQCHHVAVVVDRSAQNAKLYVDGVLVTDVTHSRYGNNIDNNAPVYIGRERLGDSGYRWYGDLDEIAFFTGVRTAAEIAQSATTALSGNEPNLMGYWKFNSGVPGGNNSGVTTAIDEKGNNDGTLIGFALTGSASNWVETPCPLGGNANQAPDCSNASIPDQKAGANCSATISAEDVTGVTDPDGDALTITVSPTSLVLGANQVTVTADDGNGGTCSTTITVNVIDDTKPTITCPENMVIDAAPGATGAVVNFDVTASDNCSATVTSSPASGSFFPLGTTTVTSTATDASGNTATCSFQVTVRPPLPHAYTLLADRDIFIKALVREDGHMHANNDIRFSDGAPATVNGNLTAVDDIKIQDDNTINGNVTAGDQVELHDETVVNGTVTANTNVTTVSIPSLSFSAGGNNVTVPQNGSMNLAPGSYGKVKVQKGGTLTLNHSGTSGDYFFEKLEVDKNASLSFDANNGPIAVNVVGKLSFGKETEVVISSPLGSNSRFVTFNSRDKVQVGDGARILGTINAPRVDVQLKKNVSFRGAISAGKIEIAKGGTYLHHDSGAILPKTVTPEVTDATDKEVEKLQESANAATPTDFVLEQNYPNPFNPSTTIRFSLPEAASVTLAIYNTNGQLVRSLVSGQMTAGQHSVTWNATDDRGTRVVSGLYLYTLKVGAVILQRKLVLMK